MQTRVRGDQGRKSKFPSLRVPGSQPKNTRIQQKKRSQNGFSFCHGLLKRVALDDGLGTLDFGFRRS